MKNIIIKITISLLATALLFYHLFIKKLELDPTILFFIFLIFLPWILSIIKSIEFFGLKIELKDAQSATNKLTQASVMINTPHRKQVTTKIKSTVSTSSPELKILSEYDPNLALVGIRIELEKRIRKIGEKYEINHHIPLLKLVKMLSDKGVFTYEIMNGLIELIGLGNKAAHGVKVSKEASDWVISKSEEIITLLDSYLEKQL